MGCMFDSNLQPVTIINIRSYFKQLSLPGTLNNLANLK